MYSSLPFVFLLKYLSFFYPLIIYHYNHPFLNFIIPFPQANIVKNYYKYVTKIPASTTDRTVTVINPPTNIGGNIWFSKALFSSLLAFMESTTSLVII